MFFSGVLGVAFWFKGTGAKALSGNVRCVIPGPRIGRSQGGCQKSDFPVGNFDGSWLYYQLPYATGKLA